MPPALTAFPFRTVTPERLSVPPVFTSSTRSRSAPSRIVRLEPAPRIVISLVMSRSPKNATSSSVPAIEVVNVPDGTMMMSCPGKAFASWIAARSEVFPFESIALPFPRLTSKVSLIVLTKNVVSNVRSSRTSAAASKCSWRVARRAFAEFDPSQNDGAKSDV